jgi:hypothetical protein
MAGPPYPIPNLQAPSGMVGLDNVTGANGASNVANYTPISTVGTQTITTGRSTPGGIFLGATVLSTGTSSYAAYDLIVTGTATTTNTLAASLAGTAADQVIAPGPGGVGVRFLGTLVVIMTGTAAGLYNTLWD